MRAGFVAALPGEARALARLRAQGAADLPGGGRIALSGMGAARAADTARRLVADGMQALVSWGSAAALAEHLVAGDLLLPGEVLAADGQRYATDSAWRRRLAAPLEACQTTGGRRVYPGTLADSAGLLADRQTKARHHAATGALGADMESAAIAAIAAESGLPFIAVRAVADDAYTTVPSAARAAIAESGALRPWALAGVFVGRPRAVHARLRALKQLAVAFRLAQAALARAAPCVLAARPA